MDPADISHDFFQKEGLLEMFLAENRATEALFRRGRSIHKQKSKRGRSYVDANSYQSQLQATTLNELWIVVTMTGVDGSITNKR